MTALLTSASTGRRAGARGARALRVSAYLMAAAVLATAIAAPAGKSTALERPNEASAPSPMVGVFTGDFVDGAPVYRLPPIRVVAHRDAGTAGLTRDERYSSARPSGGRSAESPRARSADAATVASGTRIN